MPAGVTPASVVNYALELIASQETITSLTDGSPAAEAASVIYQPTVQLLLRELDPDFARITQTLNAAVTPSQLPWWAYEYLYPPDCLRLRQVRPQPSQYDPNDPYPVRSNVAVDMIGGVLTKVILSNLSTALAVYTTSSVTEVQWDSVFAEAVARRLGNPLAMALSGRMDAAKELLQEASQIAMTGGAVDESAFRVF